MKTTITSDKIIKALAEKHANDIFISECKTGDGYSPRIDAWVMKKSWAHPLVIAYEVKISRQDFMHDTKWTDYLPFCNQFYFVCPKGVIDKNEIHDDVGLCWTSGSGTKVYIKKHAKHRDVVIPDSIWRYILMWRCKIGDERNPNSGMKEFWKGWMENRDINRAFGAMVGKAIRRKIQDEIVNVQLENTRLKKLIDKYEDVRQMLEKMGLNPENYYEYEARRRIQAGGIIPNHIENQIYSLMDNLERMKQSIENLRNNTK